MLKAARVESRSRQAVGVEQKVVEQFNSPGSYRSLPVVAAGQLGQEDEERRHCRD